MSFRSLYRKLPVIVRWKPTTEVESDDYSGSGVNSQ